MDQDHRGWVVEQEVGEEWAAAEGKADQGEIDPVPGPAASVYVQAAEKRFYIRPVLHAIKWCVQNAAQRWSADKHNRTF